MVAHQSLADSVLVTQDTASQIASTAVNGTALDMQGWTGCLFVFNLGAMVASGTFDARAMQSNTSAFTVNSNVTNATITQRANTDNTNIVLLDVRRPTLRFIKLVMTPATANTTFGVTAIRYGRTGLLPPTQTALEIVRVAAN